MPATPSTFEQAFEELPDELIVERYFVFLKNRSDATEHNKKKMFGMLKVEPLVFLKKAKENPKRVEYFLQSWISDNLRRYKPSVFKAALSTCKSFLEGCGGGQASAAIGWKRLKDMIPRAPKGTDREVLREEVRLIHDGKNLRQRFLNTLLYSSGIRVGAFYYRARPSGERDYLRVKDLEELAAPATIGKLTVYRGDIEQYFTFVTREALECWKEYRKERERDGEVITPDSPLVVWERRRNSYVYTRFRPVSERAVDMVYYLAWNSVGLTGKVRKFHLVHGFRKAFKTRLEDSGMKSVHVECLLGHYST
ncbi:MAG: hypothetical protein ACRDF4_09240, partial [Rhabdochlamydiaceae bacterium]